MNRCEQAAIPQRFERRQRRMQSVKSIEVDRPRSIGRAAHAGRCGDRELWSRRVVVLVTEWHEHIQRIRRAALKQHDQRFAARRARHRHRHRGTPQETGREAERHERQRAALEKHPAIHGIGEGSHDRILAQRR